MKQVFRYKIYNTGDYLFVVEYREEISPLKWELVNPVFFYPNTDDFYKKVTYQSGSGVSGFMILAQMPLNGSPMLARVPLLPPIPEVHSNISDVKTLSEMAERYGGYNGVAVVLNKRYSQSDIKFVLNKVLSKTSDIYEVRKLMEDFDNTYAKFRLPKYIEFEGCDELKLAQNSLQERINKGGNFKYDTQLLGKYNYIYERDNS